MFGSSEMSRRWRRTARGSALADRTLTVSGFIDVRSCPRFTGVGTTYTLSLSVRAETAGARLSERSAQGGRFETLSLPCNNSQWYSRKHEDINTEVRHLVTYRQAFCGTTPRASKQEWWHRRPISMNRHSEQPLFARKRR